MNRAAELTGLIESLGYRCALVGGLAVSVRARERFTRDIDFAVAVSSDDDAEAVTHGLLQNGYRLLGVLESRVTDYLATARFAHPEDRPGAEPTVDLLFATCGIESEVVAGATPVEVIPGVTVPVARLPHLVAMKVLSEREGRERDTDDLKALVQVASKDDLEEVRELLSLIRERGYNRGKDLESALRDVERRVRSRGRDRG